MTFGPTFYVLVDGVPLAIHDIMVWGEWMENSPERIIQQDDVGALFVSTVFLGLDHGWDGPPILFETMIFSRTNGKMNMGGMYQNRYQTRDEALAGHQEALVAARAAHEIAGDDPQAALVAFRAVFQDE